MMILNGQVLGMSGIVNALIHPEASVSNKVQRLIFVFGLFIGGTIGTGSQFRFDYTPSSILTTTHTTGMYYVGVPRQLPEISVRPLPSLARAQLFCSTYLHSR